MKLRQKMNTLRLKGKMTKELSSNPRHEKTAIPAIYVARVLFVYSV